VVSDVSAWFAAWAPEAELDPAAGQLRYTYTDEQGREHRVWQEDLDSLRRRVELVGRYRLAGVASWRAGFAEPDVWPALDRALAEAARPEPDRRSGPPRFLDAVPGPDVAPREPTPAPSPAPPPDTETGAGALNPVAAAVAAALAAGALLALSRLRG
jgi:hypothetical protein